MKERLLFLAARCLALVKSETSVDVLQMKYNLYVIFPQCCICLEVPNVSFGSKVSVPS